jgi:hypothetical protein
MLIKVFITDVKSNFVIASLEAMDKRKNAGACKYQCLRSDNHILDKYVAAPVNPTSSII